MLLFANINTKLVLYKVPKLSHRGQEMDPQSTSEIQNVLGVDPQTPHSPLELIGQLNTHYPK